MLRSMASLMDSRTANTFSGALYRRLVGLGTLRVHWDRHSGIQRWLNQDDLLTVLLHEEARGPPTRRHRPRWGGSTRERGTLGSRRGARKPDAGAGLLHFGASAPRTDTRARRALATLAFPAALRRCPGPGPGPGRGALGRGLRSSASAPRARVHLMQTEARNSPFSRTIHPSSHRQRFSFLEWVNTSGLHRRRQ